LVVHDFELNVVRFAHISFQEFLEARPEFAPHHVHRVAAESCLQSCLEGLPTGMDIDLSPKNNFYHYSAVYGAEHCGIASVHGAEYSIVRKLQEFVFDGDDVGLGFIDWVQEVNKFRERFPRDHVLARKLNSVVSSGGSPLFTACSFGLAPIIADLAHSTDYDWDQTNDDGQTGLYLAAAASHRAIVHDLLQRKVNVNTSGGKFDHPLHAACFGGHHSTVKLLLEHGADPKLGTRSALEYALLADHEDIALLILEGRLDISNQAEYDSILQKAAEAGFVSAVQFIQKVYACLYGEFGSSRCRAIEMAIFNGRSGVVERYMQKLSDPRRTIPEDAIATAALGGQNSMISMLVDRGFDLNKEGVLGTPLRAASITGHESTVRFLLNLGADLHVSGSFGPPLQAAAMRGNESITRILLSHGSDSDGWGGLYGTALQAAAHHGHQKVVEILLDAGASVYQGGFSRDTFHAASEGGHERIVRLLLEKGFQVRKDLPRQHCSMAGPSPYRNLRRNASPSQIQKSRVTSDHRHRSKEWSERVSVILFSHIVEKMRGSELSKLELIQPFDDRHGYRSRGEDNYALVAAAAKGHTTVVELLVSQLHTVDIPNSEIITAFKEACKNGHETVISLLLSVRIEVKDLEASLEIAALSGHLGVVNFLIDHEERLGLARAESLNIGGPPASSLQVRRPICLLDTVSWRWRTYQRLNELTEIQHTHKRDMTVGIILKSGSLGGHLQILRRGQDLAAQHCTADTFRHLHGDALRNATANRKINIIESVLENCSEFDFEILTTALDSVCAWGSEEALKLLLKHGATRTLGNQQYSSGLDKAIRNNHRQIVMY